MWTEDFTPPIVAPPTFLPPEPGPVPISIWESQGTFFIERPTFQVGVNETSTGVWGRQSTAVLGEPFAQKVTKLWDSNTTFYAICEEIIESVGLVWDSSKCDIQDFSIYSDNFEADDSYPIEVLNDLVELIVGAEGFVVSDRLGNVCIRRLDRAPKTSDYDITDLVVQSINEEPEWPEFGNRIKIIPAETLSQDKIILYIENQCLGTGSSAFIDVYAQVSNGEGVPINDAVVSWSFDPTIPAGIWFKYPDITKTSVQNSAEMLVSNEAKRATGFNSVDLSFEPSDIIGIWAYADKLRVKNFAPSGGYVIDGKSVLLTEETFAFCDQQVFISYYASGMVRNTIVYDTDYTEPEGSESPYGSILIIASVSGREASSELYINNSCKCRSSLSTKVNPTTITVGAGNATIEAYLENSGVPVKTTIRMVEMSRFGTLQWVSRETSTTATTEKTETINAVSGQTQCVVSSSIDTCQGVWVCVEDPITNLDVKTGSNLLSTFSGRTIDLTTFVLTGISLLVEYKRAGSVINYLTGIAAGVSRIDVSADVSTEEGLVQTVQVTVQAPVVVVPPDDPGGGGTTPPSGPAYSIRGPAACRWDPIHNGYGSGYCRYTRYDLMGSNGNLFGGTTLAVVGSGYLVPYFNLGFVTRYDTPSQTLRITMSGNASQGFPSASMDVAYSSQ